MSKKIVSIMIGRIKELVKQYCHRFPILQAIDYNGAILTKATKTCPQTATKSTSQIFTALKKGSFKPNPKLIYNTGSKTRHLQGSSTSLKPDTHSEVLQNQLFGEPKVSSDGKFVVYCAKIEKKEKGYFEGGVGREQKQDSYGEGLDGTFQVGLFLWDFQSNVTKRVALPDGIVACYPVFGKDNALFFHGISQNPHFRYGLLHCFNRPTNIYHIPFKSLSFHSKDDKQPSPLQKISTDKFSYFPIVSPDGTKLIYCSSNESGISHSFYLALQMHDLQTNTSTTLIPIIHQNLNPTRNQAFNGLMGYFNDYKMDWLDHNTIMFNTSFDSMMGIFTIDVNTKQVKRVSKVESVSDQWRIAFINRETGIAGLVVNSVAGCRVYSANFQKGEVVIQPVTQDQDGWRGQVVCEAKLADCPYQKIYLREGVPCEQRPVVVFLHGGPHGADPGILTLTRYVLLKLGFVLLVPNFSGSSGYGQDYVTSILGKATEITPKEVVKIVELQCSKSKSVICCGGSYGGYLSGLLGSRHQQHFAGAVMLNPVLSLPFMFYSTDIPEWNTGESLGRDNFDFALTGQQIKKLHEDSVMDRPLAVPGLLLVGQKDMRVPSRAASAYAAMCRATGLPFQFVSYQDQYHRFVESAGIDSAIKIALFCSERAALHSD